MVGRKRSPLQKEVGIYQLLEGQQGFPALYWAGTEGGYHIMVLELLGESLQDLFQICSTNISIPTVLTIGCQMVNYYNKM